ncbi:ketosteroid isomerase [Paenarthrobacter nitroguajacolicus]|uniref:nuclear transport factor 2 family protein n=1 Tax=Paenarthrobacter nitroguajacolicus TaxID=211146 RepID=UPI0015BE6F26|nr:nuclear transport factor 2 family protein [Paenarthrobacter nitroguajacolicus]NWL10322.1 ketosteroid isomerase [Paenarthrobacter nitroguajacolicus]
MTQHRTPAALDDLATQYEATIRRYFDGCNESDVEKMAACFTEDAVHYFPPSMYGGAWRGGRFIAERWAHFVETKGSAWTIDRLIVDTRTHEAVIEWTHYKTAEETMLRGDEWYIFDPETGLISEIRAYYAAAQHAGVAVTELEDFDYAGRGYHLSCPVPRPLPA